MENKSKRGTTVVIKRKCIVCEVRPAYHGGMCKHCLATIAKDKRNRKSPSFSRFLTFRGHVVGLRPNGHGKLKPELLRRDPEKLPQNVTINLNKFCPGFDRSIIKRFKACVLTLAEPRMAKIK